MLEQIKHFLTSPVFADDEEKTRNAYLLNIITISSSLAAASYGLVAPDEQSLFAVLAVGVTVIAWVMMRGGYVRQASIILVAGLYLVVAAASTFGGGVDAPEYMAFIVPILFSGLLLGWRSTVVVALASVLYGALLVLADFQSLLPKPSPYPLSVIWIINGLYFALAGLFVTLAIQLISQTLSRAHHELAEREQAEADLLQFKKMMDETSDAIFMIDPQTSHYLGFNRCAYQSLGYSREELSRLGVINVALHIPGMAVWQERVDLIRDKGSLIFETIYRRKDGTTFPVEVSARMLDYEGRTIMLAVTRDISARKQVELELRKREAMLEAVAFAAEQFLRTSDWRDHIRHVLDTLGTAINASQAYLFEHVVGPDGMDYSSLVYQWCAPGIPESHNPSMYDVPHLVRKEAGSTDELLSLGEVFTGTLSSFPAADRERLASQGIKSLVEVPIFVDGRWWGTIGFDDMKEERTWSALEIDPLRIAANVLGAAIKRQLDETALQHELTQRKALIDELRARNAESETLRDSLASLVSSLDFSEILRTILDQIRRVVPYDSASIWKIENETQFYITGRNVPPEITSEAYGFPISPENSAYPILKGNLPYIMNLDVQAELKDFQYEPHTYVQTWLAIPLKTRGQIIGLIALDGRQKNQFTPHHAELAVIFANQVAIALENSRLFSELQIELAERNQVEISLRQRESILAVVAEAGNLLLKTLDWKLEIDLILAKLGQTINATHAYICENHQNEHGVEVSSMTFEWTAPEFSSDLKNPKYQNVPLNEPDFESWYEGMKSGMPYIGDHSRLKQIDMDFLLDRDMKALLDVPIFVDGVWWGTIGFDDMAVFRIWSSSEVDALLLAGNLLGAAIQRQRADALLQEELNQRRILITELESKNTELERFTYTVSHDLKSPLFTIRGFLGYLEQDAVSGDMDRLTTDIQRIVDATDKMQQLLNDLLELSRIGRLMNEPQEVRFGPMIHEVLELLYGQIHEHHVNVVVQEALPDVFGDRQRLFEVVQNLVENAVKFMGDQPDPRIVIGCQGEEDQKPIFFVQDNGIGIPPEHFERIFGLFNKLDPRSTGTGIGLALVKRIIEFHGGRIWVQSDPNTGSVFYFTLPPVQEGLP